MPYENLGDLPDSVRNNLPEHAREIYRAAYNSAEDQYGEERARPPDRLERRGEQVREERTEQLGREEGQTVAKALEKRPG
jgi:cation transport regulator ChaB